MNAHALLHLRRKTLLLLSAVTLLLPALATAAIGVNEAPKEIRIGFQKSSVNLTLLKQRQALEQQLKGVKISWFEFTAGPQMLEALTVGSIDFATTGEPPPIFAQSAGSNLVYVGAEPAKPGVSAILVKQDSSIKTLADLKGKKVAFQKGSSAHYHVLRALQQAGLQWSDSRPSIWRRPMHVPRLNVTASMPGQSGILIGQQSNKAPSHGSW